jgi:hypothetical protein
MDQSLARSIRNVLLAAAFVSPQAVADSAPGEDADQQFYDTADVSAEAAGGASAGAADISMIGEIVVVGKRDQDLQQATTQVLSVLSSEDIARMGEGDIAGALGRITGISVVGSGFVYVRGLGDRYSQALLNGSPLPSPEPLRRAVPLDLFQTDIIASAVVQKSYAANLPGEFGGGLINLTTLAIPAEPFLKLELGMSGDTVTTGETAYAYYGSQYDWTGTDSGVRETPPALQAFYRSGERISSGNVDTGEIARQLVNRRNGLVQKLDDNPPNFSSSLTGGTARAIGNGDLGLIATLGYDNSWLTREITEQNAASQDLSLIDKDYRKVETENRIVANGLLGLNYDFGEGNRLRWTNLVIRDTIKRAALSEGKRNSNRPDFEFVDQETGWYERQVWSTQLAGGVNFGDTFLGGRVAYAESSREAPFEMALGYARTNQEASPFGEYFLNRLDNGQNGFARITFSDLSESVFSYGLDLSHSFTDSLVVSAGVERNSTDRESFRREFLVIAPSDLPNGVALLRPEMLLGPTVIEAFDIRLIESTESDPAFTASLDVDAAYLQVQAEVVDGLEISAGARYETAEQTVRPLAVFSTASTSATGTNLDNNYLLPALTLTYKLRNDMQLRLHGSKTIARPQFRELMFQAYFDPETNRAYRGNPLLVDSEFENAELRYEWYFAPEERLSLAGFYKKIDLPIESFTGFNDNSPVTSFANAPRATLYGIELESQKYFYLDERFDGAFFSTRRAVLIGNYTWSESSLDVKPGDLTNVFGTSPQPASNFFVDGAPLTGQSEHLVNLQIGLEDSEKLSQQTLLLAYTSDRVVSRGAAGLPDIKESPGVTVDFVWRQGARLFGQDMEFKFEARNLLSTKYDEFQQRGPNKVLFNSYDRGVKFAAKVTVSF